MLIVVLLFITTGVFIISIWRSGLTDKVINLQVSGRVTRIFHNDRRDLRWYSAEVNGTENISLEQNMHRYISTGDSLFKKKGEAFFMLKKQKTQVLWRFSIR